MSEALALGSGEPSWWQAVVRGVLVYAAALVLVRVGEKRALGKNTALDVVVAVMLGSVVSRGITSVGIGVGLVGGATLVFLHWLLSVLTFHSDRLGTLLKGSPRILVKDGEIDWSAMRKSHISRDDLLAALRAESQLDDVADIRVARLERSGQVSALERDREREPQVVSVEVEAGVQTVRIVLA